MRTAIYKSYVFKEQDPIVNRVRTVVQDTGMKNTKVSELSGVSATTLVNWWGRKTKRPQFATINAVLRACGKTLEVVDMRKGR